MSNFQDYDVVVVGAGHAGSEAAAVAARSGSKTLLITMNLQTIGQMSCNPAMGGIAKGQIVREIDALGGFSGMVTDHTMIQFRMLNKSKGPAMWSPRAQSDRWLFAAKWRWYLEQISNLDFLQDTVLDILTEGHRVTGVQTSLGYRIVSKTVILTGGTFLNGLMHVGNRKFGGGRAGESASKGITSVLCDLGFETGRMKTGTPPRVDGRSLDYSKMEIQNSDDAPEKFSYSDTPPLTDPIPCHITYTNPQVHDIVGSNLDKSPIYNGTIKSEGPRYCPSIEDKIHRFSDKSRHQIFVEPEGRQTVETYINGFSTSLPTKVQLEALRQIAGFERAKIFRPGYAIEYDYFFPTGLRHTLETRGVEGLYFAGQINGTTGYEEAACQGLMAGINAHLKWTGKAPFILDRHQAYIGVLIDDLVTKGTEEPYRMFTSRAEYRLLLRQDNADVRLTPKAFDLGLVSADRFRNVARKIRESQQLISFSKKNSADPKQVNALLEKCNTKPLNQKVRWESLLTRPQIHLEDLKEISAFADFLQSEEIGKEAQRDAEIEIKYGAYIQKEYESVAKLQKLKNLKIPEKFNYSKMNSLSIESREKLEKNRPKNIAQALQISGIKPSDIQTILVALKR